MLYAQIRRPLSTTKLVHKLKERFFDKRSHTALDLPNTNCRGIVPKMWQSVASEFIIDCAKKKDVQSQRQKKKHSELNMFRNCILKEYLNLRH